MTAPVFEAVSAVTNFSGTPSSPQTFSLNAGSNANRCVVLWIWSYTSGGAYTVSATYGGAAMTASSAVSWAGANDIFQCFVLTGAASGSNTISLSWTGSLGGVCCAAAAWSGVGTAGAFTSVNDSSGDTDATVTFSSATGALGIWGFVTQDAFAGTLTVNSTEVQRLNTTALGSFGLAGIYEKAGAASLTLQINASTTIHEIGFGLSLAPPVASGTFGRPYYSRLIGGANL